MLPIVLPSRMQEADRRTIESGTPSWVLMERAGHSVAVSAAKMVGGAYGRRVLILAGKGNNGGDGLVAARKLHRMGALVRIALTQSPRELSGDPLSMYEQLVPLRIPVGTPEASVIERVARSSDVVIDALFGTGFKGAAGGLVGSWITSVNRSETPIVSVDIPSGLDGVDGSVGGPAIRATRTVALAALKCGHVLGQGPELSGEIELADIGIRVEADDATAFVSEPEDISAMVPSRPMSAHKWSAGSVLVVGGSRGMSGAAVLTARSALEAGSGIVALAVPESLQPQIAAEHPQLLTRPLSETSDGFIDENAFVSVAELAARYDVLAVGPGLGRHPSTGVVVRRILSELTNPVVLDADGLNLLGLDAVDEVGSRAAPVVMTPHPGEMGRMLGVDAAQIDKERISVASDVASKWGCVVLLKGPRTVICGPEGVPVVNMTAGSELATAGSGDVLTGLIAALVSAGASPTSAAVAGAYIHGIAGSIAGSATGGRGVTALQLIGSLAAAIDAVSDARSGPGDGTGFRRPGN
jgi:hydroxyethylthiazole kinase-like uncharacterized protein yjeF